MLKNGSEKMQKGDRLKCRMCLKISYYNHHSWEGNIMVNCPHCLHNVLWNLSEIDRMTKAKRDRTWTHIYKKGDYFHRRYIESIGKLVGIKVEDYI